MASRAKRAFGAIAAVALAAAVALGMAGCGETGATQGSGTLKVGVRSDIVNFSLLNEQTGKYYGLEVDIAQELASRLGYADVEFSTVTPDDRKDKLLSGEVDCLVACYSIADSRLENFDFSPAYYTDATSIMVENSSLVTEVTQLEGGTFGIMSGSNAGPLLAIKLNEMGIIGDNIISNTDEGTQYEGVYVKKYPSYADLSQALEEGEVDAAVMDGSIAGTYIDDDRSLPDVNISDQLYGVATQKDSDLSPRIAEAVQAMLNDGTIAALIEKWN